MKNIRVTWSKGMGIWTFTVSVDNRVYSYETWDGLVAEDILTLVERRQTGRAFNLAKKYCKRIDKPTLEVAASRAYQPEFQF